jgi:hypothetical protein
MAKRHRETVTTKGWREFAVRKPVLAAELLAMATLDNYKSRLDGTEWGSKSRRALSDGPISPIGWFRRKLW